MRRQRRSSSNSSELSQSETCLQSCQLLVDGTRVTRGWELEGLPWPPCHGTGCQLQSECSPHHGRPAADLQWSSTVRILEYQQASEQRSSSVLIVESISWQMFTKQSCLPTGKAGSLLPNSLTNSLVCSHREPVQPHNEAFADLANTQAPEL